MESRIVPVSRSRSKSSDLTLKVRFESESSSERRGIWVPRRTFGGAMFGDCFLKLIYPPRKTARPKGDSCPGEMRRRGVAPGSASPGPGRAFPQYVRVEVAVHILWHPVQNDALRIRRCSLFRCPQTAQTAPGTSLSLRADSTIRFWMVAAERLGIPRLRAGGY